MQAKYIIPILLLQAISICSFAQNTPILSQTSASGTVTNVLTSPPEVAVFSNPNTLRSYTPFMPLTDATTLNAASGGTLTKQKVVYLNGFNTAFQTITKNISLVNGVYKNLVQIEDNRWQKNHYSFLPFAADNGNYQTTAFQQQKNYYGNLYPNEGYTSYSKSQVTSSSGERSNYIYTAGKSQVGQGNGAKTTTITNGISEIVLWGLDANSRPISLGYYDPNQLIGTLTTTPLGSSGAGTTKSYKDRDGKVILTMVADSLYSNGSSGLITYKKTYYVYGDKGELRYTLPPKLVLAFENNNGTFNSTTVDALAFQYLYDVKGRMIATRKPGEDGFTYQVYDRKERVIMTQNAKEANNSEWEINFFDPIGRVKATSIYNSNNSQSVMQSQVDSWTGGGTSDLLYFLSTPDGEKNYPSESSISGNTIMSYTYYDNYNLADPTGSVWNTYSSQLQFNEQVTLGNPETPVKSLRVAGMVTGNKIRILGSQDSDPSKTGEWRVSTIFYDDKERVIYTVGNDLYQNISIHTILTGNQYDFTGRLLISKHVVTNKNVISGDATHIELTKNQYEDNTGNLIKTIHKFDNGDWTTLSALTYDELGRLKRKTLGNGGEVQDLTYTIEGKLTGINGVYAETGNKQGYSKTFGESLKFDYGFTAPRYDGKLAGMIWRGSSASNMYAYGYDYKMDRLLKSADFRSYEGASWTNSNIDYSVSNLFYDKNGNILSMNQKGVNHNSVVDMDILLYSYENNQLSNRLHDISDGGVSDYGAGDFQDGSNGNDYSYDANGNLIEDRNKGISNAQYTRFDKPSYLNIHNPNGLSNGLIEYSYDATGDKIQEIIRDENAGIDSVTDYVDNFVYKNDLLQYALTSEGRTVVNDAGNTEEYFVKDHLGNVRSTINVSNYPLHQYLASYELASANLENLIFDNIDDVRDIRPGGQGDNTMAAKLNGSDSKGTIGTSFLVHVMAGDKVSMNVSTYYTNYNPGQDVPLTATNVMNSIISTLTGGVGGLGASESHNTKIVNSVFTPTNYGNLNNIISSQTDPSKPRAYLNYALFDENMKLVTELSGAFQATSNGDWQQIGTSSALEIPKNGYLAVYLSNSSVIATCTHCADVYFDQLLVQLSHGNLLEETHYYPHGLPIVALGSVTGDANYKENRHKYQGNELTKSLSLNWMDFAARQYDPQIGRFLSIDPMADKSGQEINSPYAAMGNMPGTTIDPNGDIYNQYANDQSKHFLAPASKMWSEDPGGGAASGNGFSGGFSMDDGGMSDALTNFGNVMVITGSAQIAQVLQMLGVNGGGNNSTVSATATNSADQTSTVNTAFTVVGQEATVDDNKQGFFGKLWGGVKNTVNSAVNLISRIQISGEMRFSIGAQIGLEEKSPLGNLGFDVNPLSVDVATAKKENILDVNSQTTTSTVVGQDHWMDLRQGVGVEAVFGGASVERTMKSPVEGGAFYNQRLTTEFWLLGKSNKVETDLGGLTTKDQEPAQTTKGLKFGFMAKFIVGFYIDFNVHLKKE